ncbi:MAG: 5-deoxy-glucuronate isomerase [Lachnospirales bacterium]
MITKEKFSAGYNSLTEIDGRYKDMLMDIGIVKESSGTKDFFETEKESAFLILTGDVDITYHKTSSNDHSKSIVNKNMKRNNIFKEKPFLLHVPSGIKVSINFNKESEILLQKTYNNKNFEAVFYTPDDIKEAYLGDGVLGNASKRIIRDIFNYSNAPYSNLVIGEVINLPGKWSSYIPHHHIQPEVYFYKFDHENGFGACFIEDDVYKITNNSFATITGGKTHPQVTSPGYSMYYTWMIRHIDGNPWTERVNDPKHTWLLGGNV